MTHVYQNAFLTRCLLRSTLLDTELMQNKNTSSLTGSSPYITPDIRAGAITAQDLACVAGADDLDGARHSRILAGYGKVKDCELHSKHGANWLRGVDCT